MTYSNTNRDKAQDKGVKGLKRAVIVVFLFIVLGYSLVNPIKQYQTLKEAEKINLQIDMDITEITDNISVLKQKVQYATSSAFKLRHLRQFKGLGLNTDFWIKYPEINEPTNIGQSDSGYEQKPNVVKWFERFFQ